MHPKPFVRSPHLDDLRPRGLAGSLTALTALLVLLTLHGCGQTASAGMSAIDHAITEAKKANITIDELKTLLADTKQKLDNGDYRSQLDITIRTASGAAQVAGQSITAFVRAQVLEDLESLKNRILGKPAPRRTPVLTNPSATSISFTDRPTKGITICGWNLDVAHGNPAEFFLEVVNAKEPPRQAAAGVVTYNGEFMLTIDTSNSGIELHPYDKQLVFRGFSKPMEIGITDSDPVIPERLKTVVGHLKTTNQDREGGICSIELFDGPNVLWKHTFPEYPTWGDGHTQPFTFSIDTRLPSAPQFRVVLTQDGAKECNILWRFEARAEIRGDKSTTLLFDQGGLQLRCGDENPATVATTVARIK